MLLFDVFFLNKVKPGYKHYTMKCDEFQLKNQKSVRQNFKSTLQQRRH